MNKWKMQEICYRKILSNFIVNDKLARCICIGIMSAIAMAYNEIEPFASYKKGKTAVINYVEEGPEIDGIENDEIWQDAVPISDFIQIDPHNLSDPSEKTEVRLLYDKQNIYVIARMFDKSPDLISTRMALRDDWYGGFDEMADYIRIEFDARHDHQTAFTFSVNASGVQLDEYVFDDSAFDGDWNAVWQAETSIDSLGWVTEIQIPFSILRFSKREEMVWGFNFHRFIQRKNEYITWVGYPRGVSGVSSKFGHLTGLEQFTIHRRLEFKPYVLGGSSQFRNVMVENRFKDFEGNVMPSNLIEVNPSRVGMDIKYTISSDASLDITVNPDYGQIEADPTDLNLTAYETYYLEKRPFFMENATIFETPIEVFYSRRIGEDIDSIFIGNKSMSISPFSQDTIKQKTNITSAAKLTGKTIGGFTYGLVRAITHNDLTGAMVRRNINKYNALRFMQDILDGNSYLGLLVTNMTNSFQSSYTASADGVFSLFDNQLYADGQIAYSNNDGIGGFGYTSSLNYQSTHPWEFWLQFEQYDKEIEINKMGYLWRNNYRNLLGGVSYHIREPGGIFKNLTLFFDYEFAKNLDNILLEKKSSMGIKLTDLNYWTMGSSFSINSKRFDDLLTYDYEVGRIGYIAKKPESKGFDVFLQSDLRLPLYGRFEWGYGDNTLGDKGWNYLGSLSWNPNINLHLDLNYYNAASEEKFHWVEITEFVDSIYINHPVTHLPVLDSIDYDIHYIFSNANSRISSITSRISANITREFSIRFYSELFKSHTKHHSYFELLSDCVYPEKTDYTTDTDSNFVYVNPFNPEHLDYEKQQWLTGERLIDPNVEPSLYPKYTSLTNNLVFRWEFRPGSALHIVYSSHRAINGVLMTNPFEILNFKSIGQWVETYRDRSIFVKLDYWFDI